MVEITLTLVMMLMTVMTHEFNEIVTHRKQKASAVHEPLRACSVSVTAASKPSEASRRVDAEKCSE